MDQGTQFLTLEGYAVEFLVRAAEYSTITLRISSAIDLAHEPLSYSEILEESKDRWLKWFNLAPRVAGAYRQTFAYVWWVSLIWRSRPL
jgi:hypothetical protein